MHSTKEAAKITADIALCRLEGSDYFQLWDCLTDGQRRDWQLGMLSTARRVPRLKTDCVSRGNAWASTVRC